MRFRPTAAAAALALVAVSSLAAGCGGGGTASPGVANVGTSSAPASSSSGPSGTSSTGAGKRDDGAKFSVCMRSHGVRNFPDPGNGGISINPSNGINPNSTVFQAAQRACQKLLHISPPSAAEQAKMQAQALKFSSCMRSHGVPKFPDPVFSQGATKLTLDSKSGIDPRSPIFQAAQKACQSVMPGKGGAHTTVGGPGTGQQLSSGPAK